VDCKTADLCNLLKGSAMKFVAAFLAASLLAGCACFGGQPAATADAPEAATAYAHIDVEGEVATPAERAACEAAGGEISRQGLLGWEHCVQTYPDGGEACRNSSDCLGTCRSDGEAQPGEESAGTCQVIDVPFGCYSVVEDGKAQPALCVD
jgi:hypothetical protein